MEKQMKVAILGAGNIANAMAEAVKGIPEEAVLYAVGSRSQERADAFAKKWDIPKSYGSYEELAKDKNIDLVYVATPHSEHYENTKLCLENGRNCLVEKAFCGNRAQAEKLIALAKEKKVLLAEAMWTRYQPSKDIIREILASGVIGEIKTLEDDFAIQVRGLERMEKPELAGGALLDLGIYSLTVPAMYLGYDIEKISTNCQITELGVDLYDDITFLYKNGVKANVKCSFGEKEPANYAKITGDKGYVVFGPINVPNDISIYDADGELVEKRELPIRVNGYEYQVLSCKQAILEGKQEVPELPWSETLRMMGWMDSIRCHIGVAYPFETAEDRTHSDMEVWGLEKAFE